MAEGSNDLIQFDGGALVADMLADASAEDAQELSQFALERGSSINDHVVRQPRKLTLQLVQTETPIRFDLEGFDQVQRTVDAASRPAGVQTNDVPVRQKEFRPTSLLALSQAAQAALFGGAAKSIRVTGVKADGPVELNPLKVTVLARDGDVGRVNAFHDALLALLDNVTPVAVTVKQRQYSDMIVTSVSRTDAAGQVGCARFQVVLQQVNVAETRLVELPPVPAATKAKNVGKKDPKPTPKEPELRSILDVAGVGILNGLGAGITP